MARNVFISFRYSDGIDYKEELTGLFDEDEDTVDFSEDEDRSQMSDETIRDFLYKKLRRSSVTIVLLTPKAIEYNKGLRINQTTSGFETYYDDWIYDEVRYSLEDRENNSTNGLVAVYVPEAEDMLFTRATHICSVCKEESEVLSINNFNNLVRKNMMNVKTEYKKRKCSGIYDTNYDSYCSLISYEEFKKDFYHYIDLAAQKRKELYKYDICKRL